MKYRSTRGLKESFDAARAILGGLAPDGGLFVPDFFPPLVLEDMINLDYKTLCLTLLKAFFKDLGPGLEKLVSVYSLFSTENVVELKEIDGTFFLELYHGPSLAFKDLALVLLPGLLELSRQVLKTGDKLFILTATSGDTGKAAIKNFAGHKNSIIVVLFPEGGVSKIQKLQMLTQVGENVHVLGIKGNFDDAQRAVKELSTKREFLDFLTGKGYILSSANSINIGRLIPQLSYYIYSYLELVRRQEIHIGQEIDVVVPTGNFGNLLAAYYAKKMGLPLAKLICASNDNKVLSDFFNTGVYDAKRELVRTSSPSMDIIVSSNLERLLYSLSGQDGALTKSLMENLSKEGSFTTNLDLSDFYSDHLSEEEVSKTIKKLFKKGYLIDPHTAVAYGVYEKYLSEEGSERKAMVISTASPFKFPEKILQSLDQDPEDDIYKNLQKLSEVSGLDIPKALAGLKDKKILHDRLVSINELESLIKEILGGDHV